MKKIRIPILTAIVFFIFLFSSCAEYVNQKLGKTVPVPVKYQEVNFAVWDWAIGYQDKLIPAFTVTDWNKLNCLTDVLEVTVEGIPSEDIPKLCLKYHDSDCELFPGVVIGENLKAHEKFSITRQCCLSKNINSTDEIYYEIYYLEEDLDKAIFISDYNISVTPESKGFQLTKEEWNDWDHHLKFNQLFYSKTSAIQYGQWLNTHIEFDSPLNMDNLSFYLVYAEDNWINVFAEQLGAVSQGHNEINLSCQFNSSGMLLDNFVYILGANNVQADGNEIILENMNISAYIDDWAMYENNTEENQEETENQEEINVENNTESMEFKNGSDSYYYSNSLISAFTDTDWTEINCFTDVLEVTFEGVPSEDLAKLQFSCFSGSGNIVSHNAFCTNLEKGKAFVITRTYPIAETISSSDSVSYQFSYDSDNLNKALKITSYNVKVSKKTVGFMFWKSGENDSSLRHEIRFNQIASSESSVIKNEQYLKTCLEFDSPAAYQDINLLFYNDQTNGGILVNYYLGSARSGHNKININRQIVNYNIPEEGWAYSKCKYVIYLHDDKISDDQIIFSDMKITASIED